MSDDFDYEVEDTNEDESSMLDTWLERFLPPLLTYCLRKCNLLWLRFLKLVMVLSARPFGQGVEVGISEREEWAWLKDWSLPRYKAYVEKKD